MKKTALFLALSLGGICAANAATQATSTVTISGAAVYSIEAQPAKILGTWLGKDANVGGFIVSNAGPIEGKAEVVFDGANMCRSESSTSPCYVNNSDPSKHILVYAEGLDWADATGFTTPVINAGATSTINMKATQEQTLTPGVYELTANVQVATN
ncbi:hypothetical protein BIB77_002490 [Salmonella enterica subsp. enterica serovar Colorado]|uniref:Fimbrial protein n=1 Tax=Salmonella enterica TaxID=28901 RepID=A0A5Y7WJB6_SALER|nr:hypothetical protein [Salmonella enterica]ECA1971523.1 hypothetical protein [Salmonella enterica subsp. enterica serovar Colorado]ECQ3075003.1 hypothetical protein [Salmonella enterica]EDW7947258.1 hypothetical protein [Salmonella enterica subsp. enterica serovar Colorado]HCL5121936.1 hypothetical protein [Salmonella enterica]